MLKQFRFAVAWLVPVGLSALTVATPAAAQVSSVSHGFQAGRF